MRAIQRSRRSRLVRLAALPLVAAFIAASCGGSDEKSVETTAAPEVSSADTTAPAGVDDTLPPEAVVETIPVDDEETPVAGGTLRYGLEADVDGLNPTTSALSAPGLMMSNAVFDSLAAIDENGNAIPYLAESFTSSEDFKTWTVKLRPGIKFHDGTDLTSEAVIKSFEAQRADPLVGLAVKPFFPETGATEVIDDLTVKFNLSDPNAYFPATVTGQLGYVPSPTWLDAALADPTLNQKPVGTGPFKYDSRSEDSVTKFVRNDEWWNGEVYLDAIEFYPVSDADTRLELLVNGELDALQTTNQGSLADLRDDESLQNLFDDTGEESFVMINSASPPFDDIRARQALTYATPRQNYIDLITTFIRGN